MATLEELVTQFKQIPDYDRYPLPEVFYEKFGFKKPKPVDEVSVTYQPPAYQSLNENGKVELRGPVEGGVREIKELQVLPVEVKRLNDETGELEDYPPPPPAPPLPTTVEELLAACLKGQVYDVPLRIKDQTAYDTWKCSLEDLLNLPKASNKKETQPESGLPSEGPSDACPDTSSVGPHSRF